MHPLRLRAGGATAAAAAHGASPSKSTRPKRARSATRIIAMSSIFFVVAAAALILARKLHIPIAASSSPDQTASLMPPSKAWLEGTRMGNVDDGITKQDVQNLIAEGAKSQASFEFIIGESICSKSSPVVQTIPSFADLDAFATSTANNKVNLTGSDMSQLIYRAIHENQYGSARDEAINRLQHWDEWRALASDGGIGLLDFECPSAKFVLFDGFTLPVGLGSNLRRFGNVDVFRTAMSHNRVFLYVHGDRPNAFASCDRMDLQCSFAPMSPCVITQEEMDAASVAPHDLDAYLRQNPTERIVRVKQKTGYSTSTAGDQIHGLVRSLEGLQDRVSNGGEAESSFVDNLAAALLSAGNTEMEVGDMIGAAAELFITRLNRRMKGIVEKSMRESFPIGFVASKAIGMPIRASDKCQKEAHCISFGDYMGQLHSQFPMHDFRRVVVTSEDETIIKASESYSEEHDEDFTFLTNGHDVTQGTGEYSDLPQSKRGYNKEDILASTMTAWAFQLEPGHMFLNFCSNFHVVIFDSIRFGCARSNSASTKKQNITCNVGRGL